MCVRPSVRTKPHKLECARADTAASERPNGTGRKMSGVLAAPFGTPPTVHQLRLLCSAGLLARILPVPGSRRRHWLVPTVRSNAARATAECHTTGCVPAGGMGHSTRQWILSNATAALPRGWFPIRHSTERRRPRRSPGESRSKCYGGSQCVSLHPGVVHPVCSHSVS